jgi:ribosomal protein L3 glutamine methyltransferase
VLSYVTRHAQFKIQHSKLNTEARRWTAGGLVRLGTRRFREARLVFGHGSTTARDEAAYLALHALGLPLDGGPAVLGRRVRPLDARRVLALFARRIRSRKPASYLTREAWLGDFSFYVDERVIVPRSHIAGLLRENLVPWISRPRTVTAALDLCTGSGCLAVLLAHIFPRARIDAADISPAALAVAKINRQRYKLGNRVRLVESDLFSALGGKYYDLIICNPPYVTARSIRRLPREYRHEPRAALAGGRDGLDVVRRILATASGHLNPRGLLVVEVGAGRKTAEKAWPRLPFTWLDEDGGVFVLSREELEADAPVPAARAK